MEACSKAVYERVLDDMLGSINDDTGGGWKVLILDQFTTRVLSSALKMSDILERNVSVVEDVSKVREPMPLAGVYFLTPTAQSIAQLIEDFSGPQPLYPSVHVFFSSKLSPSALSKIKACPGLIKVIKTLKESNLEFLVVDSHTLITDHPDSPELLLGDQADVLTREVEKELDGIASRFTTALATLNEFPAVRYRRGKAPEVGDPPGGGTRSQLTQRLAGKVLERVDAMRAQGQLPAKETCDLLILDRSYDPVVPFIHEWTYECLVYDLLDIVEGSVYRYKVELQSGKSDEKDAHLEETDALWTELRHVFIAEVYSTLGSRFKEFQSKNKAAKLGSDGLKGKGDMTSSSIRQLITALPQFREILSKLSLHIQISEDLRKVTNERILTDVGELEQDLVLGEKNSKDMLAFLQENQHLMSVGDKVRLLMCYCATHPEKLDASKIQTWSKTARLSPHDMMALTNLALLGVPVMKSEKQERSGKSFFGGSKKEKPDLIRAKKQDDGGYALNRFEPLLRDILVDMAGGRLPVADFPYARPPSSDADTGIAASARTAGRAGLTWTKRQPGGAGGSGGPAARRLVVLIVGGALRSEMRVCHELSRVLQREVILASTSVETPGSYLQHLHRMNSSGVIYGA